MHYSIFTSLTICICLFMNLTHANEASELEKRKSLATHFLTYLSTGNTQQIRKNLSHKAQLKLDKELIRNKDIKFNKSLQTAIFKNETERKDGSWQEHFKNKEHGYNWVLSVFIVFEKGEYKISRIQQGYVVG